MDETDYKILCCLKENSRINATAIGNRIELSTSSVIERIRRLENSVIRQYTVIIDQEKIGKELTAYIYVRLDHPKYNDGFCQQVKLNNDIVECHYLAGDFDYLLKIITSNSKSLEQAHYYIKAIEGVSLTRTQVVLTTIKNEISPMPDPSAWQ